MKDRIFPDYNKGSVNSSGVWGGSKNYGNFNFIKLTSERKFGVDNMVKEIFIYLDYP